MYEFTHEQKILYHDGMPSQGSENVDAQSKEKITPETMPSRKKTFTLFTLLFILSATIAFGAWAYTKYFKGVLPAFTKPSHDITQSINSTDMPLTLPDGFAISIFAQGFEQPRVLAIDPAGTLIASIRGEGKVVALPDSDNDGVSDQTILIAQDLSSPHGLAFKCADASDACILYVAEIDKISTFDYDSATHTASNKQTLIALPNDGRHRTKTLMFHPTQSDSLLVSIGSSCDTCFETDATRATIQIINDLAEPKLEPFAVGLRNSVFMTTHPATKEVWATEMGRDFLGDNLPPDEINIFPPRKSGGGNFLDSETDVVITPDYGWPICYGDNVHDTTFDKDLYSFESPTSVCDALDKIPVHINLQAHSAPLGLAFIPNSWAEKYQGDLLVSFHGSWNRSEPTGYKIVRIDLDDEGNELKQEDFISGWLVSLDDALGRPVDLKFDTKGNLFVSDDKAGVIYRVSTIVEDPATNTCVVTGCSGQVCSDKHEATTCEYKEEYACYRDAICERQTSGECGWTMTEELTECLGTLKVIQS